MLVVAFKPGHDGAVAAIGDGRLVMSLESEKDSFARYSPLTPVTLLELADQLGELPDVVAVGGWNSKVEAGRSALHVRGTFGAGYFGTGSVVTRDSSFFGKPVRYFSSSHERSHIFGALGMAPRGDQPLQAVLVWEGITGSFYLVDAENRVVRTVPVLTQPGARFAALFAICDPTFAGGFVRLNDSGKLMALAAFGDPHSDDPEVTQVVERLLKLDNLFPVPKAEFQDSPLFNCGVESEPAKTAAAVLTERLFRVFADAAVQHLPEGIPLRISGGCGLNCDWNAAWRRLGHFSSVFVPPCPNDSGSALGTAIDAVATLTGDPYIDWDVYAGLDFVNDARPDPVRWRHRPLDEDALAAELAGGKVVAWVQGRWEIGPRALGNRSLLAEPFRRETHELLNRIKQRESYRPIAPCARVEDLGDVFDTVFEDPHMLYFRRVVDRRLEAVTHVDGSARVQTVSAEGNPAQHSLLTAFARRTGTGVLCNTSLNFSGHGFVNRMSHLIEYCESRGIGDMVVGDDWYRYAGQ
jgi:hydroxymethyl cephem carbamoyltransferase